MKKIIFLAIMFVIFGCSDNSVSPDPTEVSTNPAGTVTEPNETTTTLTAPAEPEKMEITLKERLISILPSSDSTVKYLNYAFLDIQKWSPDITLNAIVLIINDTSAERIITIPDYMQNELAFDRLVNTPNYIELIRNDIINRYIELGITDQVEIETGINTLCKFIEDWKTLRDVVFGEVPEYINRVW